MIMVYNSGVSGVGVGVELLEILISKRKMIMVI